jgi:hypothetical protein
MTRNEDDFGWNILSCFNGLKKSGLDVFMDVFHIRIYIWVAFIFA